MSRLARHVAFAGLSVALWPSVVASQGAVEVLLMPLRESASDERVVKLVETSCGRLALARLGSMPPAREGRLGAPDAYTVSPEGVVEQRWALPADAVPRAATAFSVVVSTHLGLLAISSDRSVTSASLPPGLQQARAVACPGEIGRSQLAGFKCIALPRLGSAGESVLVAYQSACTVQ